jgi:long-chain acyl-CoA synthetase
MALEFHNALKAHAKNFPDKAAIIDGETTISYGELLEKAEKFAGGLDSLNPGPKSKMAILSVNQNEFLIALLGCFIKGIPVVPINFLFGPDHLVHIVQEAEIDILMVDKFFVVPGSEKFFSLFPHKVTVGSMEDPKLIGEGAQDFEDFIANGNREAGCKRHVREEGIPDVILYTSGTTAKPKGVMLDESQFNANITGILGNAPFSEEDRAIMALPLFHSFGNIIALLFIRIGGSIILIRQFAPKAILANITEHKATILPLVPTIYSFLLDVYARGGYDVSTLRYCVSGGAALPTALLHMVEEALGVTVLEGYGLTETTPVIAVNTFEHGSVPGSVGPVLSNLNVKIVDEKENDVDQGGQGEIIVKGETIMRGYWKQPEATAEILSPDGWLKTGDLGHLDEHNRLYISAGRKKDIIIRAGENVSPLTIENAMMNHPSVAEAAAIGVPHERKGEQVVLCISLREGEEVSDSDMKDYCRNNLPPFMAPDIIKIYPTLPKNATGKILKTKLRDQALPKK